MYMQMGGNPGDGATLARQTGAAQAAEGARRRPQGAVLGLGAGDDDQPVQGGGRRQARPASRSWAIPGSAAFHDLVKSAVDQGIVVTVGNSPMTDLQAEFGPKGIGYAGVDLYAGGELTAERHDRRRASSPATRRWSMACSARPSAASPRRASPTRWRRPASRSTGSRSRQEANSDASLAVPVLAAYIQAHPEPQGDRHPARRHHRRSRRGAEEGRQEAGRDHRRRHRPRAGHHRRAEVRLRLGRRSTSSSTCRASCRSCSAC